LSLVSTPPGPRGRPAPGWASPSRWAGPGSALDNAVIESWHSTLESGLRRVEDLATRAAARGRVAAWIDDYNRRRLHSALRMMSPIGYERALTAAKAA
jgi:putative transposase